MNVNRLKGKIKEKEKTQEDVAKILNLTQKTVSLKLQNGSFKTNEMSLLASYLELTCQEAVEIFLPEMLRDRKQTCKMV